MIRRPRDESETCPGFRLAVPPGPLVRMKVPGGSFYRSVSTGSVKQVPEERKIAGEMKRFGIEGAPGQGAAGMVESANSDREYEVSYRSGGGIAIAALAMASAHPVAGQFRSSDYLNGR